MDREILKIEPEITIQTVTGVFSVTFQTGAINRFIHKQRGGE